MQTEVGKTGPPEKEATRGKGYNAPSNAYLKETTVTKGHGVEPRGDLTIATKKREKRERKRVLTLCSEKPTGKRHREVKKRAD